HELMHVVMYRAVGPGYRNIPAWLREGMATLAETYPNADYNRVLAESADANRLLPLQDLCVSFPADAGQAFLAYAESRSFTNYLYSKYGSGSTGLLSLVTQYASGVDCESGPARAFGVPLSTLEMNWRSSVLGQNTFLPVLQNASPYLVLLCLILIIPFIGIMITVRKKENEDEQESYE
ncbi:MAG TPA: peptidase MA family metallohydrolase, partial [Anaerolineales bacterium]|nr:peptidase MA family metallohydrolase [Anaerolineales bacterium]